MTDKPVPLTKEGLSKIQEELEFLMTVRRPQIARRIQEAKELTSAQNNAEYEDAKNEQAFVRAHSTAGAHHPERLLDRRRGGPSRYPRPAWLDGHLSTRRERLHYTIVGSAEANRVRDASATNRRWARPCSTKASAMRYK
jgi:transcription elongation factor GreA